MVKALRQGETELTSDSSAPRLREIVDDGVADLLTQTGTFSKGKYLRRSSMMNVPTFDELIGDKKPKGLAWEAYLAWVRSVQVDKWIALPPGTPREIVQVHQLAFEKVVKDPEFNRPRIAASSPFSGALLLRTPTAVSPHTTRTKNSGEPKLRTRGRKIGRDRNRTRAPKMPPMAELLSPQSPLVFRAVPAWHLFFQLSSLLASNLADVC